MPFLAHIAFDNDRRLKRPNYLFEYAGIRFKLVQSDPRKWADHLLSIVPSNTEENRQRVFSIAAEFISALGWQLGSRVAIWNNGGISWNQGMRLSQARPRIFVFPSIPFGGSIVGYSPIVIPKIEKPEQRVALALYREARACNKDYLSFLFYWQVLESGGTKADQFADACQKKRQKELHGVSKDISSLAITGRGLGAFLQDEFRHAIAHVRRKPGSKRIELDDMRERENLAKAVKIVRCLAEIYIERHLGLTERLYLMREGRNGFPVYRDIGREDGWRWKLAYQL